MLRPINKLVLLFLFSITSCKSQNIEKKLRDCVNTEINEYHYFDEPNYFDFYEFILKIENSIVKDNLLKEIKRENYKGLLFSIIEREKDYSKSLEKILGVFNENKFYLYSVDIIFNQCPYKISKSGTGNEYEKLYLKGKILNEIMKSGYNNKKLISELFSNYTSIDFEKIEYRAVIILLVAINMDLVENR